MTKGITIPADKKVVNGYDLTLLRRMTDLKTNPRGLGFKGVTPEELVNDDVIRKSFSQIGPLDKLTVESMKNYLDDLTQYGFILKRIGMDQYAVAAYGDQILTIFKDVEVV